MIEKKRFNNVCLVQTLHNSSELHKVMGIAFNKNKENNANICIFLESKILLVCKQ